MWPELTVEEGKRWSGMLCLGTPEWEAAWKALALQLHASRAIGLGPLERVKRQASGESGALVAE